MNETNITQKPNKGKLLPQSGGCKVRQAGGERFMNALSECKFHGDGKDIDSLIKYLLDAAKCFDAVAKTPDSVGNKSFHRAATLASICSYAVENLELLKEAQGILRRILNRK